MTEKTDYAILNKIVRLFHYEFKTRMENESWKELRLLKHVIFAKAQRTVAVVNARHPASLLARPAAVSQISSVRAQRKASNCKYLNAA